MFTKSDLKAAEQFRRAIQMLAAALTEDQALEVATVYHKYRTEQHYSAGEYITCGTDANGDPLLYKVVQDHTSQEDWPPESTPSLYTCISLSPGGYPVWVPPAGAHDAYNTGDVVSYQGKLWKSKIDGNTTVPGEDDRWWGMYEPV